MADERPLPETLLDWLVYAPLGAATLAVEELPRLAELGRERFERQIGVAGMIGRFAVAEAVRRFGASSQGLSSEPAQPRPFPRPLISNSDGPAARPPLPTSSAMAPDSALRAARRTQASRDTDKAARPRSGGRRRNSEAPQVAPSTRAHELPIPAYDTLAASQVVERLASLTPAELESVRKHESATRRRRTVLHKIAQLNAERDGATA
ncbi:MAG: hypothetical protein ABSD97_03455 [Acidimicrobiales bacterium]